MREVSQLLLPQYGEEEKQYTYLAFKELPGWAVSVVIKLTQEEEPALRSSHIQQHLKR